ncbi:PAS domain-containing sensor histidine kinase [Rubrolithibacter danxiaensis]|uniref:PAS domain-containing sensor histidine kinase n=1 Tax=Rubrolithibacter danxiaensis TaxID=3390805 RepID=UPI003BF7EFB5
MDVQDMRNQADNIFLNKQDFYKEIIESLEDYVVFATDKEGQIITWNNGARNIFQYSKDEAIGQNASILFTPEDRAAGEDIKELTTALTDGKAVNERYHIRKDGSIFWGSGLVFPLYNYEHIHIGFAKVMRNRTERKKKEDELVAAREYAESIVENAPEPLIVLNEDLTITTANTSFCHFFNVEKKEIERVSIYNLNKQQLNIIMLRKMLEGIEEKGSFTDLELELDFTEKGKRVVLLSARKLALRNSNKQMILLSLTDVTNKKEVEKQKDDFIGVASHELKTPVTSIIAYAHILQRFDKKVNDLTFTNSIKRINYQAAKLNKLIRSLLDTSNIQAGRLIIHKEEIDLNEVVSETVNELQVLYKTHAIRIEGVVSVKVFADRIRVSQVITNLISNAIKYSPNASEVIVRLSQDLAVSKAIISVKDFGIGISVQEQDKLFKRFSRAKNIHNQNIQGIGLGLYISLEIAKKHGGDIWFESQSGKGSTFYFSISIK